MRQKEKIELWHSAPLYRKKKASQRGDADTVDNLLQTISVGNYCTPSVRFYKAFQTAGFELFSTLSEFAKTSYISEQREY